MIDLEAIGSRLFSTNPQPNAVLDIPAEPIGGGPLPAPVAADEDPATCIEVEPESLAERLFGDDGTPPTDGNYLPIIGSVFDELDRQARSDGVDEDLAAIAEGRQAVNTTLQELGVGAPAAQELSIALAGFHHSPVSDDGIEAANERGHKHLQDFWGRKYDQNLAHARAGYQAAIKRVPWLKDEIENGAGSDPAVIKHFASIGRRMAGKARR